MSLQVYPYTRYEGKWSIHDNVMASIWLQLEHENKTEQLFYDGGIVDIVGWLSLLKDNKVFPLVVADTDKQVPVHIAWLKDIADDFAWMHHTAIGNYRRGAWEAMVDYWRQSDLRILLGMTPETNTKALKFVTKICHATIVGTIPELCYMHYLGGKVGGVLSYYRLKDGDTWAEKGAA